MSYNVIDKVAYRSKKPFQFPPNPVEYEKKIYEKGLQYERPPFTFQTDKWEAQASERMSAEARGYVVGSAGTGETARKNREAFAKWSIVPDRLVKTQGFPVCIEMGAGLLGGSNALLLSLVSPISSTYLRWLQALANPSACSSAGPFRKSPRSKTPLPPRHSTSRRTADLQPGRRSRHRRRRSTRRRSTHNEFREQREHRRRRPSERGRRPLVPIVLAGERAQRHHSFYPVKGAEGGILCTGCYVGYVYPWLEAE